MKRAGKLETAGKGGKTHNSCVKTVEKAGKRVGGCRWKIAAEKKLNNGKRSLKYVTTQRLSAAVCTTFKKNLYEYV